MCKSYPKVERDCRFRLSGAPVQLSKIRNDEQLKIPDRTCETLIFPAAGLEEHEK